ncbi:VOC family protein [Marinifilum flexuosum]|uniref:Lactoylglutathione lyase n=1 Tax=Marinifilum flexuosum TaxID=1117708 RepID=A0A419X635_9BACT|nr:VOC family protein [Marinifilum flexuosum]RKE03198.1 lactoylglutathione lyase [Marinifilum flexuosum]
MRIEHLAIWTLDLESMRSFYMKYFKMISSKKYHNEKKGFTSYFLSFEGEKSRIELMYRDDITKESKDRESCLGFTHFAISVGGKEKVDELTELMRADQCRIVGEPRTTGDGYYESVVLDCEGNRVEITE